MGSLDSSGMYRMSAVANLVMASVAGCSERSPHRQSNPTCRLNLRHPPCESKVLLALEWATWPGQCYVDGTKTITLTPQGPYPSLAQTLFIKKLIPIVLPYKCLFADHHDMGLKASLSITEIRCLHVGYYKFYVIGCQKYGRIELSVK